MISVCIATYNGEKFIKEQLDSILCQLSSDDEIIISDDQSTDKTINIIKSYNDSRIKIFFHSKSTYTANFENALLNASGEYIFLADQDDIWKKEKVSICMEYLQRYDFVMTDASVVDEQLNLIEVSRNKKFNIRNGFFNNFRKTYYLGCCMAFRKNVLDYVLPFPTNHLLCLHDAWISLNAELLFKTRIIEEPLLLYRRHSNVVSNGSATTRTNTLLKIIKIRLYLIVNIVLRIMKKKL